MIMMMLLIISPFGQLGLWASSQGCKTYDDDENKPVWPTWAVGILSGVQDV
jgi:hypothetical protein